MTSFNKVLPRLAVFILVVMGVSAASAQDARINFDRLNALESRASDFVEVNIDGKLLELAKRVTVKVNDPNAKKAGEAISGLKGIYVRVYRFQNENEYNISDVDEIRSQLSAPGWEKLANVRSKKNNQKVDVYTMFTGDIMSGVAVVISESKSIALVNIIGPIDIESLIEISGKMNIPEIDIDKDEVKIPEQPKNEKE
ncbi:MAG: DUF4252 domain-containing protein [Acidobacteriota bacterium]